MNGKIVVVGGGGYIGYNFIKKIRLDKQVITVIRNSKKHINKINYLTNKNIPYLNDIESLNELNLDENTTIVYLAGYSISDHSFPDIGHIINTYVTDLTKTLEVCRKNKSKLIIVGSYWELVEVPNSTSINLYAAILKSQNPIVNYFAETFNLTITKVYLSDVYGPGDWRPKLLPNLLKNLSNNIETKLGSPKQIIAPIYLDDVIEILEQIVDENHKNYGGLKFSEIQIEPMKIYSLEEYIKELESFFQQPLMISWNLQEKIRADILEYPS